MREQVFRTPITDLLGIRHPILSGGLMWLSDARYVAASVNAGSMGFMTAKTFPDPGAWREELVKCGEFTGGKPFGVNLYLSVRTEQNEMLDGHIDLALDAGVRIFETAGLPPAAIVTRLREAGATVIHKVATVRHAVSAARKLDIDAVTVVGAECGGHPGLDLVGSMVQGPLAAQRIEIPVLIGGGIGHGSQVAAVLGFGCAGVILGTRMLVAREIWSRQEIKERVLASGEADSRTILASMRNTYRVLDNETSRAVAELEARGETDYEAYRPYIQGTFQREAYETGDPEKGVLSMGQSAAFADAIEPVEAIIDRMIDQAIEATNRVTGLRASQKSAAE